MVNALGVLGWGVGGIEIETVMLGQSYHLPNPEFVGVRLDGAYENSALVAGRQQLSKAGIRLAAVLNNSIR